MNLTELIASGFHAELAQTDLEQENYNFALDLTLNGSEGITFAPFGEETDIEMKSSWPHPKFVGNVLPTAHEITDK